jgi:hypothetical protein
MADANFQRMFVGQLVHSEHKVLSVWQGPYDKASPAPLCNGYVGCPGGGGGLMHMHDSQQA